MGDEFGAGELEPGGLTGPDRWALAALRRTGALATGLDAIVRNTLRDDFAKLDQWDRASEFGKAKPKRDEPAPTPQAPPPSA